MHKVVIERPAESDLDEGYVRYENIRRGLGEGFLLAIEDAIGHAARNPGIYPIILESVRRAVTRRFPYLVLYTVERRTLYVLAVFQGQRSSRSMKKALRSRIQDRS